MPTLATWGAVWLSKGGRWGALASSLGGSGEQSGLSGIWWEQAMSPGLTDFSWWTLVTSVPVEGLELYLKEKLELLVTRVCDPCDMGDKAQKLVRS